MSATVKKVSAQSLFNGTVLEQQATDYYIVYWPADETGTAITAVEAVADAGIVYASAHPEDSDLLVKQIQARATNEDAGPGAFVVQVDYSSLIDASPLSLPDEVTWDFSESTEKYFFDENPAGAKPVTTSAGEPFDSIPERESGAISVSVSRNVPTTFDPSALLDFWKQINSDTITIDGVSVTARQCKFSGASLGPIVKAQTTLGLVYYRVCKFSLKLREDWNDIFSDQGYHDLDGSGKLRDILIGTPPTKVDRPYPLNGSGVRQADPTTAPASLTFYPYAQTAFSSLSFT